MALEIIDLIVVGFFSGVGSAIANYIVMEHVIKRLKQGVE